MNMMRNRIFLLLIPFFVLSVGIIYVLNNNALQTITYFPIDQENQFVEAKSELESSDQTDDSFYNITWTSNSKSNHDLYLRQDASLLFDNGRLRGVRSKWEQDTASIQLKESLSGKDDSFFQVITYHHGEVHYPDDTIKSIQHMSQDKLYVSANKKLDKTTKKQLLYHWNQLFKHFNIDETSYTSVPLRSEERRVGKLVLSSDVCSSDLSLFQVITYHQGEVHYPDDTIKSIQHMSQDKLYVSANKKLDKTTKKQLLYHWNQLFKHFNIDETSYTSVPL